MWFVRRLSLTVFFVSLTMALALGASNLSAQQTTSVSGKITSAFTHQDSIVVGDVVGHIMSLATSEGKNVNTGEHTFMDGAKVVNMSHSDLTMGSGIHQGYIQFIKNGDTATSKWEGKVTTVLDSVSAPVTSFEGVFSYTKGTGQFENIKGNGTYSGEFTSKTGYTVDWQSDYFIEK